MYLVFVCAVFVIYVWYLEETTIFHPDSVINRTPESVGLAYEDVYMRTEDGVDIHGWFVKTPQAKNTVLFFHGNAGNIADRIEKAQLFVQMGLNVFMVDYRGYGKSSGKPAEGGLYKDALAAHTYLADRPDVDSRRLIVYGASLGGVVAIDLAAQRNVGALVIDSSFSSAADMARVIFPFVPSFLVRTKMDSMTKIKAVHVPKLFFHSRGDETVPFALGQKLYQAAVSPKEFVEIRGTHNDGYLTSQTIFIDSTKNFLKQYKLL